MSLIQIGALASFLAGLATGAGALPALFFSKVSDKLLNMGLGYGRWKAVGIATLTGLVEPVGGILGVAAVTFFNPILPFALAFAAGAMLFVISDEIIPETHSKGKSRHATFGVMTGFVIMMAMDNLLG